MERHDVTKPTRFFGLSRNVVSMGIVSFLNDLSSDMIFPFIPIFLVSELKTGATFVGLVEGIADATASVLKMVSGRLSDLWRKRKPFIVFGYAISAVAKPLLAVAAVPWHVLLVRVLDRIGKGTRDAPRDTLISFSAPKKDVGRAFGFHRGADTLGAALGPLIAFVILPFIHYNLRTLFLLSFVASFFAVLIVKFAVREVNPVFAGKSGVNGQDHRIESAAEVSGGAFPFKRMNVFAVSGLGIPFLIFLFSATILSLGRASEAFLLLRAQNLGVALGFLPVIYFVYNITFAIFSTPAGVLADRIGHRNTYMIGMIIFSGTYFLFARANSALFVWTLFAVYGFYSAFTEGVGRAIVADLVEERFRATAYGIYNAFTGFVLLPASLVFGFFWDRYGASFSFQYGALLGIIAFLLFLILRILNHRVASRGA